MPKKYELVFDDIILKQLKKAGKNQQVRMILSKMLDKITLLGPLAGDLIDSKLFLYEMKSKRPPIRLYYEYDKPKNIINIFEYEMKTSEKKQKNTINKLRKKLSKP